MDDAGNLRITRRGGFGTDLTDNAVIRVTMRYTGEPGPDGGGPTNRIFGPRFTGAFFDKGRRLDDAHAKLSSTTSFTVPNGTSVAADVYLNYTIRHVSAGADTYEERDDDTLDSTVGPIRRRTTLVSADDAATAGYAVQVGIDGGDRLSVKQGGRSAEVLCFASRLMVLDFIAFMQTASVSSTRMVGGYAVGLVKPEVNLGSPVPLSKSEVRGLRLHPGC